MTIDTLVIKEVDYPPELSWSTVEEWADGIPTFSEDDPKNPEWDETPTSLHDLTKEGYGVVHIKDESVNPTGTAKARPAWEDTTIYRDTARSLLLQKSTINGNIPTLPVPQVTLITAGNEGHAIAHFFQKYNCPPPNLIVDINTPAARMKSLKQLRANIYAVDLSQRTLTTADIKKVSGKKNIIDLTSVISTRPQQLSYDWFSHEALNQEPDEIYVPYGSGRIVENLITWQEINTRKYLAHNKPDPRLKTPIEKLVNISILGAEPERIDSQADKLPAHFKPFRIFDDHDISALIDFSFTGRNTGVYKTKEAYIAHAHQILTEKGIAAEPSAAAGLALYMQRYDAGLTNKHQKTLIVNTGKGI